MNGPILLSAIVGASVSFLVALSFNLRQKTREQGREGSRYQSQEQGVWE
jgi:hypothetical protein